LDTIQLAIAALKREKDALQNKIDAVSSSSNRNSAVGAEKELIQQLKVKKSALIEEKKSLNKRKDDSKALQDRLLNERKAAKVQVRFESLAKIEEEIQKLKRLQQSTSMSLTDEKKLIKEIDTLQTSKMMLADLDANQKKIDVSRDIIKTLNEELKLKDSAIDAVKKDIEDREKALQSLGDSEKEAREGRKKLLDHREELKKQIDAKYKELDQVRDTFRKETDAWFDYQRAVKAQERLKREEERKKREEEHLAYLKKKEEEELKKVPYEEEMYLCDFLADYLTRTYLSDKKTESSSSSKSNESTAAVTLSTQENPFANIKPANKKTDDIFLQMSSKSKQTRPRTESSLKKSSKASSGTVQFTMSIEMFEQFGWVHLIPPMSLEGVEKSVSELKEKKVWYSQQPRGTVMTAKDMRKAKEKGGTKSSSENGITDSNATSTATSTTTTSKGGRNKGFDLSSDEQFAPLSSTTAGLGSSSSSWIESSNKPTSIPRGDNNDDDDGVDNLEEAATAAEDTA